MWKKETSVWWNNSGLPGDAGTPSVFKQIWDKALFEQLKRFNPEPKRARISELDMA